MANGEKNDVSWFTTLDISVYCYCCNMSFGERKMRQQLLNELAWELDKIVQDKMNENPYGNEDSVREYVATEFADWLVNNFKKDCGYED